MRFRNVLIATVVVFFAITLLDIAIVVGYVAPRNLWSSVFFSDYHWFLFFVLQVTLPILLAAVLRNAAPVVISVLTLFGVEDTLYYLLQGYLPSRYSGVAILGIYEPSLMLVLVINLVGLLFAAVFVRRVCYGKLEIIQPKITAAIK